MRKITIYTLFIMLCLNFKIKAQESIAVDVTAKGILIGQKIPDITITGLHNYKDGNGKLATTAKLSDFKGKLLILDFWATWCSPCIAMIPKMDSLQKNFGDKLQFLSVTYQSEKEVIPFLEKFEKQNGKHYDLPNLIGDKELHRLFPHITLPHFVWIDENGIVKAITEFKEVNATNIQKTIQTPTASLAQKRDLKVAYDNNKPFLINGNGGDGANILYHSVFTGFTEGIPAGYSIKAIENNAGKKITARNLGMLQLFRIAYGGNGSYYGWNKIVVETKDSSNLRSKLSGNEYENWKRSGNAYCYEVVTPASLSDKALDIMQRDLKGFFPQYTVQVEKRLVKCLLLKRTSNINKISTSGSSRLLEFSGMGINMRNSNLDVMIMRLNVLYMQNSPYPIVNGTGYYGNVDISIDCNLSKIEEVNRELAKYDLHFFVEDFETDILVVKDAPSYQIKKKI